MAEPWGWDGCCADCQVMIEWHGDEPEDGDEAAEIRCYECEVDALRSELAALRALADGVADTHDTIPPRVLGLLAAVRAARGPR